MSAQNAVSHGIYGCGVRPVLRGAFAEDPVELDNYVIPIVESLDPRIPVERAQATLVAGLYNQLRRLDRYEAEAISGDGKASQFEKEQLNERTARQISDIALLIGEVIEGARGPGEWNPEVVTQNLVALSAKPTPSLPDVWTEERKPEDEEEWARVFWILVDRWWPDRVEATRWAYGKYRKYEKLADDLEGADWEYAAQRILATLEKSSKLRSRLAVELGRALDRYIALRSRDLPTQDDVGGDS